MRARLLFRVDAHFHVDGEYIIDHNSSCFCAPCSAVQMAREVETEACFMQCNEGEEYKAEDEVVVAMIV